MKAKKTTKRVKEGANTITEGIVNTIRNAGYSASRINTEGQYDEHLYGYQKGGWRPSGSRKGYFDVSACIEGRGVVIEVKYDGDTMSQDQKDFKAEWEAAGGTTFVCKSWESFTFWWEEMQPIIRKWRELRLTENLF